MKNKKIKLILKCIHLYKHKSFNNIQNNHA